MSPGLLYNENFDSKEYLLNGTIKAFLKIFLKKQ